MTNDYWGESSCSTAPIATPKAIHVSLAGNQIKCGSNGGNLFLKSTTAAGGQMQVTWQWFGAPQGQQFSLQFLPLVLEDDEDPTTAWPFVGDCTVRRSHAAGDQHTFTLKPDINYLGKYTVFVGNLHLDPVIIIER